MRDDDANRGADAFLTAIVLGSAAGGGFPQWNCGCANCRDAFAGVAGLEARTQSSLAVSGDGADWALLNASPDLRSQILATKALQPRRPGRDSPITSVLLTNGDLDHIAGLVTLREKQPFTLWATAEILAILEANPIFAALDRSLVDFKAATMDAPFALTPTVEATLFRVPGKAPLFLEGAAPAAPDAPQAALSDFTVGVSLRRPGARDAAFYIPGCAAMTPALAARIDGAAALFFDGTVYHDDEMIRAGVGVKTGRRMGHMPMAGPEGSLAALRDVAAARKIYVHINNTNPVLRPDAPERAAVAAAGWEVAHDGLTLPLRAPAETGR
ncbi:MAG: pyrroloquinoline quinone biosynthesis protein PqqB [Pseudomonadota bacterium]